MKKGVGRILVVSSEPQETTSTADAREFYDAIWFSRAPEDIQIGQKVQVWFGNIDQSYPGQSSISEILVLPSKKPDNANLSEDQAISKAIASFEDDTKGVPVIKTVKYDTKSGVWNIHITGTYRESEFNIQIDDKVNKEYMEMRKIAWGSLSEDTKKTVLGDWQTAKVTEARGESIPMLKSKERPEWIRKVLFHTNQDELLGPIRLYIDPSIKEIVGYDLRM